MAGFWRPWSRADRAAASLAPGSDPSAGRRCPVAARCDRYPAWPACARCRQCPRDLVHARSGKPRARDKRLDRRVRNALHLLGHRRQCQDLCAVRLAAGRRSGAGFRAGGGRPMPPCAGTSRRAAAARKSMRFVAFGDRNRLGHLNMSRNLFRQRLSRLRAMPTLAAGRSTSRSASDRLHGRRISPAIQPAGAQLHKARRRQHRGDSRQRRRNAELPDLRGLLIELEYPETCPRLLDCRASKRPD